MLVKRIGFGLLAAWAVGATLMLLAPTTILSPPRFRMIVGDNADYVSVVGTWALENGEIANPISTTTIDCFKGPMECTEATFTIFDGLRILPEVQIRYLKIINWTDASIKVHDTSAHCASSVLEIDTSLKTVKSLSTRNESLPVCRELLTRPEARAYLADGYVIAKAERQKRQPRLLKALAALFE